MTDTFNPYTFVPLRSRTRGEAFSFPAPDTPEKKISGRISCQMKTVTETAVPGAQGDDGTYPLFRVVGEPAMPGSSIRGVVRSVYETLTDSCMVLRDQRFHARSQYKKPGLLHKDAEGIYWLQPAKRLRADTAGAAALPIGTKCSYTTYSVDGRDYAKGIRADDADGTGYFLKVETFTNAITGKQSKPSIFEATADPAACVDKRYVEECFVENIGLYDLEQRGLRKGQPKRVAVAYRAAYDNMISDPDFRLPVWYLEVGGAYEFAPSQVSRSVYAKTPSEFAADLGLGPCEDLGSCCPACSLFGFVGRESGNAKAGRVRFCDARAVSMPSMPIWKTLPPLMEPRISAIEFYLRNDANPRRFAVTDSDTVLSGRKYYWHHEPMGGEPQGRQDLLTEMEFFPKGSEFEFDVYFDRVTEDELGVLVYALTLGGYWMDGESALLPLHKIGHAKPLGYGSVMIKVSEILVRDVLSGSYVVSELGNLKKPSSLNALALLRISNRDATDGKVVDYPRRGGEIYKWFAKNRRTFDDGTGEFDGSIEFVEILERDGKPGYRDSQDDPRRTVEFGGGGTSSGTMEKAFTLGTADSEAGKAKKVVKFAKKKPKSGDSWKYEHVTCPNCEKNSGFVLKTDIPADGNWKCNRCS